MSDRGAGDEASDDDRRQRPGDLEDLHAEFEKAYVYAARSAQRLADGAERLGLNPEAVAGTGDLIYGVVVQQLLLGARVARHARELSERAVGAALDARASTRRSLVAMRVPTVGAPEPAQMVIRNNSPVGGALRTAISTEDSTDGAPPSGITVRFAREQLETGRSTSMRIELDRITFPRPPTGTAWVGTIEVYVRSEQERRLIEVVDLEVWWDG